MGSADKKVNPRKVEYRNKLEGLLTTYKNILLVSSDNVGSRQMQQIRLSLRGRAVVLMGKNTIVRKVMKDNSATNKKLEKLLPLLFGNFGMVFTNDNLLEIRKIIESNQVPAAARPGAIAPVDVTVPPGPTGLDPGQTAFFQALNIGTKIVKGTIEIINAVHLIKKGDRVSPSAVSLLSKLNIRPFFYRMSVNNVYEDGSVYSVAVLDLTPNELLSRFFAGVRALAAISLAIGRPNLATLPHSFARAFKNALALSIESTFTFPAAQKYKDYLADPKAYAAKHGLSSGSAAPAAAGAAAPAAAAAKAPEPEEEEEAPADFDLFG